MFHNEINTPRIILSDVLTEYFLAIFERFIDRKGIPIEIWSDNDTKFMSANRKLKEFVEFFQKSKDELVSKI